MNSYASVGDIKGALLGNVSVTTHDVRLRELLEAVSRTVEAYCHRHFHSLIATRYFSGDGSNKLWLPAAYPDLIAVTSLKEDENNDATYETTWATTDYVLGPYDAAPTGRVYLASTKPYGWIEIDGRSTGTKKSFPAGQRRFELVGKWGYSESVRRDVATITVASATTTTGTLSSDIGDVAAGHTLLLGTEQVYVQARSTTTLTLVRGVNGTTAATQAAGTVIDIIEYPAPVREATLLEAGLLLETRGYRRALGTPETGIITPFGRTFSAETRQKLDYYRSGLGMVV